MEIKLPLAIEKWLQTPAKCPILFCLVRNQKQTKIALNLSWAWSCVLYNMWRDRKNILDTARRKRETLCQGKRFLISLVLTMLHNLGNRRACLSRQDGRQDFLQICSDSTFPYRMKLNVFFKGTKHIMLWFWCC